MKTHAIDEAIARLSHSAQPQRYDRRVFWAIVSFIGALVLYGLIALGIAAFLIGDGGR